MPIKGLSTRGARYPVIGKLRKGAEKEQNSNRPGKDLNYLRFTSEEEELVKRFYDTYGPEPSQLTVLLPYDTAEDNFTSWREHYVAGGLMHRCDGETCVVWRDEHGSFQHTPKPCPGECKPHGYLSVVIPELKMIGTVTVLTTSSHDIAFLDSTLKAFELARGSLRGMELYLSRRPRQISRPDPQGNRRVRVEKYLLWIEPTPEGITRQLQQMRQAALAQAEATTLLLTDGEDEAEDANAGEAPEQPKYSTTEPLTKEQFDEIGRLADDLLSLGKFDDPAAIKRHAKARTGQSSRSGLTEAQAASYIEVLREMKTEAEGAMAASKG